MAANDTTDASSTVLIVLTILTALGYLLLSVASFAPVAALQALTCYTSKAIWQRVMGPTNDTEHDAAFFCLPAVAHIVLMVMSFSANTINHKAFGRELNAMMQVLFLWFFWAALAASIIVLTGLTAVTLALCVMVAEQSRLSFRRWRRSSARQVDEETALLDLTSDGSLLGDYLNEEFEEDMIESEIIEPKASPVDSVMTPLAKAHTERQPYRG